MDTRRRILTNTKSGSNGVTYQIESVDLPLAFDGQDTSGYLPYFEGAGWALRIWYSIDYTGNYTGTLTLKYTYSGRSGEEMSNTPITVGLRLDYGAIGFDGAASLAKNGPGAIFGINDTVYTSGSSLRVIRLFNNRIGTNKDVAYDINLKLADDGR